MARPIPEPPPVTTAVVTRTLRQRGSQAQRISLPIMRTLLSPYSCPQGRLKNCFLPAKTLGIPDARTPCEHGSLVSSVWLNSRRRNVRFARGENEIIRVLRSQHAIAGHRHDNRG